MHQDLFEAISQLAKLTIVAENSQLFASKISNVSGSVFYLKTLRSPFARVDIQVQVFIWTVVGHLLCSKDTYKYILVPVGANSSARIHQTGPLSSLR